MNSADRSSGPAQATAPTEAEIRRLPRSTAITDRHLDRLAIVYVRQSSPQQVFDHQQSRERQYALADYAVALGWPKDRVLVIDEDQGRSGRTSDHRPGFQRLLTEVTLDHVGLILGLELSRLSRSSKDWYHLIELCGVFGTLLADQDGLYDPNDANGRLVLGLKGTMSEIEMFTMRNRLERGKLHKAERGELISFVPCGYVKLPNGEVALDPDEQTRATVRLVFDKFDELGSFTKLYRYLCRNNVRLGTRIRHGARQGELVWQVPTKSRLARMLHHPIYAGAYAYGRRRTDPKRTASAGGKVRMREAPMAEWLVLKLDRLPAYITWDRYMANQRRLAQNRSKPDVPGAPRLGAALLTGVLVCGACGRRMHPGYRNKSKPYYVCMRRKLDGSDCHGLGAQAIDRLVGEQVLRAIEPAALELSLKAIGDVRRDRERLRRHWEQRLERARYEAERAERQYHAVEPENRLVVRTLEQRWEEALREQRSLQEEMDRLFREHPPHVNEDERLRILALSTDVAQLWSAPETTASERKEIVRLLVERVIVQVRPDSEWMDVTIVWRGGSPTEHRVARTVSRYESLSRYSELIDRIIELRRGGRTIREIVVKLNEEGFRTPRSGKGYTSTSVRKLLSRAGLANGRNDS
jgi:DNA invertase Pin-like site-specific DNA recombinase